MHLPTRVSRLIALVRYHHPSQFAWRIARIIQRRIRRFLPAGVVFAPGNSRLSWAPGARAVFEQIARNRIHLWIDREIDTTQIAEGVFQFLGESRRLGDLAQSTQINWNPDAPRLWRFHLQCHENLLEIADRENPGLAYRIIQSWLQEPRHQSPTLDPDAWHPFCISRRLPVWLSLAAMHDPPAELADQFWCSIADQLQWLKRNCEWDIGGNHLLENLTTIYLLESFFLTESNQSLFDVERLLERELGKQILESGEHFERVPTYHCLVLVCLLMCADAAKFQQSSLQPSLTTAISKMARLLHWIRQSDGHVPLLGDSTYDETPQLDRLLAWARFRRDNEVDKAAHGDYWATTSPADDRLLFDTGPLACDHLPAHGHADLLQVTATLAGKALIVDSGNYQYEPGAMRDHCRGTAAHNVMQIDDLELCDTWSSFRMGTRGHVIWRRNDRTDGFCWCAAAHDGFGAPAGRIVIATAEAWTVIDWASPRANPFKMTSRIHLHPDWHFRESNNKPIALRHPGVENRTPIFSALGMRVEAIVESSHYCPTFGTKVENQRLTLVNRHQAFGWIGWNLSLGTSKATSLPKVDLTEKSIQFSVEQVGAVQGESKQVESICLDLMTGGTM